MKQPVLDFLHSSIQLLAALPRDQWAEMFVTLRMAFSRCHSKGFIFSTRFGSDFFTEVHDRVTNNKPLVSDTKEPLGEYDLNFNRWLKTLI